MKDDARKINLDSSVAYLKTTGISKGVLIKRE